MYTGAVYRYYESRQRIVNDSKTERCTQVTKDIANTRKYSKKKRGKVNHKEYKLFHEVV